MQNDIEYVMVNHIQRKIYNRDIPNQKIRAYDIGNVLANNGESIYVNLDSKEKEQISSEALETAKFWKKCEIKAYHLRVRVHLWHAIHINKMLSCSGAHRFQTGMRNTFGNTEGKVTIVKINDILISVRCKEEQSVVYIAKDALTIPIPILNIKINLIIPNFF